MRGGALSFPHARRSCQNGRVVCNLSRVTRVLGEYTQEALAQEAVDLHRADRHRAARPTRCWSSATSRAILANRVRCPSVRGESGDLPRFGRPPRWGSSLHPLAVAAFAERNLKAQTLCEQSLAIFRAWMCGAQWRRCWPAWGIVDTAGQSESALAALTEALELAWRVGPRWVVEASLEGIAKVAARQEQATMAVELCSAAAALRAQIEDPVRPNWQADLEQTLARAQVTLGQEVYADAWAQGRGAAPSRSDHCRGGSAGSIT